jgi:hypothetical protein
MITAWPQRLAGLILKRLLTAAWPAVAALHRTVERRCFFAKKNGAAIFFCVAHRRRAAVVVEWIASNAVTNP